MKEKFDTVLVVADKRRAIEELTFGASSLGKHVFLAYTGRRDDAVCAEVAYYFGDDDISFVSCIPEIVSLASRLRPQLVMCSSTQNGRLAAAAVSAAFGVGVMSDCMEIHIKDGFAVSTRMVYGGAAVKTERALGNPAIACPADGAFEVSGSAPVGVITDMPLSEGGVHLLERRRKQALSKSISTAKNVVGIGRGLGSDDNLPLAQSLAGIIGGEVGCTRPVAEEYKWLPKELNIGISGASIKPNLYIACGISGQIQHLVGINGSRVIAAINKDENAPVFAACDFGIVGDLNIILPALIEKFKQAE
ncbi:MAG: electron transfer flavoprotein subunit alpha/FixB family protein [Oscillospiraceae bacterium]